MKRYSGKNVESILNEIATNQGVNVEDIEYKLIDESGFAMFKTYEIEAYTYKDCMETMKSYIMDVIEAMGLEVEVDVEYDGADYQVDVDTNNNALIIGVNGKNLYALETLLKQVMSNYYHKRFYLTLDINNYFKDKEEKLKRFAYKIAAEVGKIKMEIKLDPMPNYDRKVIHKVLKDVHYVETKSHGEGKDRHLVVYYDEENDLKHNNKKED